MKKIVITLFIIINIANYTWAKDMEKIADIEIIIADKKAEGVIYNTSAGKDFLKKSKKFHKSS